MEIQKVASKRTIPEYSNRPIVRIPPNFQFVSGLALGEFGECARGTRPVGLLDILLLFNGFVLWLCFLGRVLIETLACMFCTIFTFDPILYLLKCLLESALKIFSRELEAQRLDPSWFSLGLDRLPLAIAGQRKPILE